MPKKSDKELSIIVLSYGSVKYLERCFLSIDRKIAGRVDYELILVNNEEGIDVFFLSQRFPDLKIISCANKGFGAGNNFANRYAQGKILLFLNPDTEIVSDNIESVISLFDNHGEIGIIGSNLLLPGGENQAWSCGQAASLKEVVKNKTMIRSKNRPWRKNKKALVDWVSGTALFIRKSLFEQLGGFDEKFFMYFEDMDLCTRARQAGRKVVYNPDFSILHYGGKSYQDKTKQRRDYHISQKYYFQKHYGMIHAVILSVLRKILSK